MSSQTGMAFKSKLSVWLTIKLILLKVLLVQTHIRSHSSQPDIQYLPHYYFKNTALQQLNCKVSGDEVGASCIQIVPDTL